MSAITTLTALGAGFLASLSPCIYPMLPITLGFLTKTASASGDGRSKPKTQVVAFFLGQVFMFTVLGLVAVKVGEIFGFSSQSKFVNISVAIVLLFFAIASYNNKFQTLFAWLNSKVPQFGGNGATVMSGFLFGVSSALVASPCTSPVLGGVLSQIATEGNVWIGILNMVAFSIGMGLIFLLAGLGLLNFKKLPKAGKWLGAVHKFTSLLLFFASGYYFWLAFGST